MSCLPSGDSEDEWWYLVERIDGYSLIPLCIQPDAIVIFAKHPTLEVATDQILHWVGPAAPGRLHGGRAKLLASDFLVVGFKPDALVRYLAGS